MVEEGAQVVGGLVELIGVLIEERQKEFLALVAIVLDPATDGSSGQL